MIKSNQRFFNFILVLFDMCVVTASLLFAWYIRFVSPFFDDGVRTMNLRAYIDLLAIIIPLYLILFVFFGLYQPYRKQRFFKECREIVFANIIGITILMSALFTMKSIHFSRYMLGIFFITSTMMMILERGSIRKILRMARERGFNIKYIIIVGAGSIGQTFAAKVAGDRQLGYKVTGYVDDYYHKSDKDGIPILGKTREMNEILEEYQVDEVIIALPNTSYKRIDEVIDICEYQGIKTQIIPDYFHLIQGTTAYFDELDGIPLINTRYIPLDQPLNKWIKRFIDIILSILIMILVSPIMLVTAILVKMTSPGPIIYKQIRVGMGRKEFWIYKFRSMRCDAAIPGEIGWTTENDPRKTKFGAFIRKTSIDELPQFFNVLKGDMSIVGPRPERPHYVTQFQHEIPKYMIKHHVRPGITGWAQVQGWRGDTSIHKRIECDIEYIEKWTLWFDVKVFFMTFKAVFESGY
ncbi:undecaprenyl-phosphate glucose phosphotransferase [Acetobacterium malicum]|uniref:Undecaprenyl-phosphate glucose phosphotransferase n=1 Tax=Acetobacterium malicum TaxID=52692 RepID=A0ABR6YXU5_9FIRM|nr:MULTISPECIES: undecaprenyl-phosphate glucose phosphotransferase [Acetobacterium]MBC3899932.1 undecaprenyl-phosphate glucose phosphotransferase [Acetobacterium malicum]